MDEEEFIEAEETEALVPAKEVNPADYALSLYITDNLKQIFLLILLVGNFISVNISVVFMCLAWYVRSSLEKQITFLQDFYNPQAVPAMLGISGCAMLVASVIGVKASIGGRMVDDEEGITSASWFFFIYSVAAAVAFGAVFIAAFTCFIHIGVLSSALGDGLLAGMEKYMNNSELKPELDVLQMDYKCCGSESYKDWYKVAWVDVKFLDTTDGFISKNMKNGKYTGKDVPFSCCKRNVVRPCVDTRIENPKYHSKYDFPADLTLYTTGCQEAVTGFLGHTVFRGVGLFVFICSLLWMMLATLGRYLNTSMTYLSVGEPPIGWLVPYVNPKLSLYKKPTEDEEAPEPEEPESD